MERKRARDAARRRRTEERRDEAAGAVGDARPADPAGAGDHDEHGLDLERLVFFSDAVFAIAITLLVIELRLPPLPERPTSEEFMAALGAVVPAVFAYVLSFATIGLYWLAHWRRFRLIDRVDERLAGINLVLLGLIAFIPFPTALIGEHGDEPVIVVLYAVALAAAGFAGPLSWVYAWRARLVRPDVDLRLVRFGALRGFSVPIVMLASLPFLPIIGPYNVERSWFLIIPVQLAMNRWLRRGANRPPSPRR